MVWSIRILCRRRIRRCPGLHHFRRHIFRGCGRAGDQSGHHAPPDGVADRVHPAAWPGLRKAENKEYVVVLDFIGNYRNNFMIPIALSGDRSYNKDNIRRYVTEGGRVIPGASTIHFDEISRKRIFQAIDNANFSDIKLIRENYTNLKNKLGHIPALADFDKYGEMDVLRIFDNNSLGSYYKFLVKYEKEYTIRLSEDEEKAIEFISKKLAEWQADS